MAWTLERADEILRAVYANPPWDSANIDYFMPRKRPNASDAQTTSTTIRLRESELGEIRRRAKALGLTLTDYMLRKALGQPAGDEDYDRMLNDHEERLERLERKAFRDA